mgnify:CR=1 FL=1
MGRHHLHRRIVEARDGTLFLSLGDPWRALDPRYARSAASLGASKARVLWRVKLPLLLAPRRKSALAA